MRLPNTDRAVIPDAKIRDYLLAAGHKSGGPKAVVYRALGYLVDDWPRLRSDLREQHLPLDAEISDEDEHGVYHVIRGTLTGPNGRSGRFMSVWLVRFGEDFPRFITAYPTEK